jgi:hypothetical protein
MPLSADPKTAFPKNEDLSLPLDDWDMGKSPGKVHSGAFGGRRSPYTEGHMDNLAPEPLPASPVVNRPRSGGAKDAWTWSEWREPDEDYLILS